MIYKMSYSELFQQITANDTLFTPNKRLARFLARSYNEQQGKTHLSLDCVPYTTWLEQLYQKLCQQKIITAKILLKPQQQQLLWQKIISQHYSGIKSNASLVKQIQAAWTLLHDWMLDINDPRIAESFDGRHFQHWCREYQNTLQKNSWLDRACLAQEILSALKQKQIFPEKKRFFCIGFLDPTPAHQQIWGHLIEQGNEVIAHNQQENINQTAVQINFEHIETEAKAMAVFAKSIHDKTPSATIACIVPDLNKRHDAIDHVFRTTFSCMFSENHTLPFTSSYGKPLIKHAIIETAMLILSLKKYNSHELINQLLLSPFIAGDNEELQQRSLHIDKLNQLPFKISSYELQNITANTVPVFSQLIANTRPYPQQKTSIDKWLELFLERLSVFGFPGEATLRSHDFQLLTAFQNVLTACKNLNVIQQSCSVFQALNFVKQACQDSLFQAESNPQANIHILGLLEATDIPFDYVWHSGLSEKEWPQNHGINPFLPAKLQSTVKMPGACHDHNTQYHDTLLKRRINSCRHFYTSFISQQDGINTQASYCIQNLQKASHQQFFISIEKKSFPCEHYTDWQAPAVSDSEIIKGGSQIIKRQALCPFKAFAESRLNAQPLESVMLGLNYKIKGQILHQIMQTLWTEIESLDKLKSLSQQQRQETINRHIDTALSRYTKILSYYINNEKKRLNRLINTWLDIELSREPFHIKAVEKSTKLQLNKLTLHMRIDRIDQLSTGGYVLIDYKSSQNSILSWLGERPEEPQLPLYSLCFDTMPAAICFAQLNSKQCKFTGISQEKNILPQVKPLTDNDFPTLMTQWRATFLKLSDDFTAGCAIIDPKNQQKTCSTCHLQALCRVHSNLQNDSE